MERRALTISGLLCAVLLIGGCSVRPSEVSDALVRNFSSNVRYAQDDRTGLCFALIATKKQLQLTQNGLGMTNVPCTEEVLALVGE